MVTDFTIVYNCFYSKITDDMYMELDEAQTKSLACELLINALPWFEFPRVNIMSYDLNKQTFNVALTQEEVNIIATYMMIAWIDQQLASVEVTRMKYSGSDFKFTSQANHMSKLKELRKEYERVGFHLQRLYKRRKADVNGVMRSTLGSIMAASSGYTFPTTTTPATPVPTPTPGGSDEESWEDMEDLVKPKPDGSEGVWEDM